MKRPKINLHKAWEMFRLHEHPSRETLDHIALLAGFQSWDDLHSAFEEEYDSGEITETEEEEAKEIS